LCQKNHDCRVETHRFTSGQKGNTGTCQGRNIHALPFIEQICTGAHSGKIQAVFCEIAPFTPKTIKEDQKKKWGQEKKSYGLQAVAGPPRGPASPLLIVATAWEIRQEWSVKFDSGD
jgi:hypothetical protein